MKIAIGIIIIVAVIAISIFLKLKKKKQSKYIKVICTQCRKEVTIEKTPNLPESFVCKECRNDRAFYSKILKRS